MENPQALSSLILLLLRYRKQDSIIKKIICNNITDFSPRQKKQHDLVMLETERISVTPVTDSKSLLCWHWKL